MHDSGACLRTRQDGNIGEHDVVRQVKDVPDHLGDIVSGQWLEPFVHRFRAVSISFETYERELGLRHTGTHYCHFDPRGIKVQTHAFRDRIHGKLACTIDRAFRVYFLSRDGADINDMSALPLYHTRE